MPDNVNWCNLFFLLHFYIRKRKSSLITVQLFPILSIKQQVQRCQNYEEEGMSGSELLLFLFVAEWKKAHYFEVDHMHILQG